jgi:CheY-like chemotaxis protein
VRLPLRKPEVSPQDRVIESTSVQSVSRKVLIADDNHNAAESPAALLRMDGHSVTVVRNGHEALSASSTYLPEVALLDIGMPGLSGHEFARGMRKSDRGRGRRAHCKLRVGDRLETRPKRSRLDSTII